MNKKADEEDSLQRLLDDDVHEQSPDLLLTIPNSKLLTVNELKFNETNEKLNGSVENLKKNKFTVIKYNENNIIKSTATANTTTTTASQSKSKLELSSASSPSISNRYLD